MEVHTLGLTSYHFVSLLSFVSTGSAAVLAALSFIGSTFDSCRRKIVSQPFVPTGDLVRAAADVIRRVRSIIDLSIRERPGQVLRKITLSLPDKEKRALAIDKTAEETAIDELRKLFGSNIEVFGEESLGELVDLNNIDKVCALLDMVDGTDLVELGVPLWCSAVIFFDPRIPRILGAIVGLPSGEIFCAHEDRVSSYVYRDPTSIFLAETMRGPSGVKSFRDASICFYGQKAKNFLCFETRPDFQEWLRLLSPDSPFRIYNFAGNPIMVKLADRLKEKLRNGSEQPICRGFDAVIDIGGQYPHDCIPGVYIAKRAGAFLCDLHGIEISEDALADKLRRPTQRMSYILAATEELASEISSLVTTSLVRA